jgi:hypothetical protein
MLLAFFIYANTFALPHPTKAKSVKLSVSAALEDPIRRQVAKKSLLVTTDKQAASAEEKPVPTEFSTKITKLKALHPKSNLGIEQTNAGVLLTVPNEVLFTGNQSSIQVRALPILKDIAQILKKENASLSIVVFGKKEESKEALFVDDLKKATSLQRAFLDSSMIREKLYSTTSYPKEENQPETTVFSVQFTEEDA